MVFYIAKLVVISNMKFFYTKKEVKFYYKYIVFIGLVFVEILSFAGIFSFVFIPKIGSYCLLFLIPAFLGGLGFLYRNYILKKINDD